MNKVEIVIRAEYKPASGYGISRLGPSITLTVMGREEGKPYPVNLTGNSMQSTVFADIFPKRAHGKCLDGVGLHMHTYHGEELCLIGGDPSIYDAHRIDARELRGYQKALDAINRAISKTSEPDRINHKLLGLAKAVGATAVVAKTEGSDEWYQNARWEWMTIAEGVQHVLRLEQRALQDERQHVSA